MPDTMPTQAQAIWLRSTRCPTAGDPPGQIESSPADAGEFSLNAAAMGELRAAHPRRKEAPSRRAVLAELCLRQLLNLHAPAAVLCNARRECLYSYGPTGSYLRLAPSHSTPDVMAMAPDAMRTRVRSALGRALRDHARVVVPGGHRVRDGHSVPFNIDVQPLQGGGEALLLVCFVDAPTGPQGRRRGVASQDAPRIAELEQELEAMRAELAKNAQSAIAGQMSRAVQARLPLPQAVQDMTADAIDLIEQASSPGKSLACRESAAKHIAGLTPRQRQIMGLVLAGHPSKNIAADLGVSQRTVENHRASIMKRTGSRSLPALARLAVAAGNIDEDLAQPSAPTAKAAPLPAYEHGAMKAGKPLGVLP